MNIKNKALVDLELFCADIKNYLYICAEKVATKRNSDSIESGDIIDVVDNIRYLLGKEFMKFTEEAK